MQLTIPQFGYRIETRKMVIDPDSLPNILTSKRQWKITCAVRGNNDVTIIKHVIVCPACGKETPAYAKFVNHDQSFKGKSKAEIDWWTTNQLSLFGEPPEIMFFNTPVEGLKQLVCPHCGAVLPPSEHAVHAIIRAKKNKIKVLRRLDLEDGVSITWIKDFEVPEFELYETITFNLRNGHTYVSLENEAGTKYAIRDISNDELKMMSEDPVAELVSTYKPIYRKLKNFFRKFWNGSLPFSSHELNLETFVLLTKFIGYNRAFYDALPSPNFEEGDYIEESFVRIAKRLHHVNQVPALFEISQLPNIKSVRKIIFSKPALLFYQTELDAFWQIWNDPNLFCAFLESRNVYRELLVLRKYPRIMEFYQEFAAMVGGKPLCKILSNIDNFMHAYALEYLWLNDSERKIERQKWTGSYLSKLTSKKEWIPGRLVPVQILPQNKIIPECRIDSYLFRRLSNSKEYIAAGTELQNCLRNWEIFHGDVYGVSKCGKYVAAIEIMGITILQAHTFCNGEMSTDLPLFSAFSIWKERNGLVEYRDDLAENEG